MTVTSQSISLITEHFQESIACKQAALSCISTIDQAATWLIKCLEQNGKVMMCGNGGSAGDCQHFAAELTNRYETERRPLAGLALTTDSSALTAIANDYAYQYVFSKQIQALSRPQDCLVAISTSGQSPSIMQAIHTALDHQLKVIALTGNNGGLITQIEDSNLLSICVPHQRTARIQEVHLLIIHAWCALIDLAFTPAKASQ